MKKELLSKILPHIVAPILFLLAAYIYFSPLIEGKALAQHDVVQWKGQVKEIQDYRQSTGEETLWTNTMFGGMPAYLISVRFTTDLVSWADWILQVGKAPASFIFATMLGFYILLLVLGVNPWLSIVGAFGYGLSTYFFCAIGAGHNAKVHAIAYVAPMLAGMILAFRGKLWGGFALFALFFGLNLYAGHPQITYYATFIMVAITIAYFLKSYKERLLFQFGKALGVLAIAGLLAFGANFSKLWFTYDYGKDSIRGPSELTSNNSNKTSGLDKDYAMGWSYGVAESFNLMIPNLMGGSSSGDQLGTDSKTYNFLKENGLSSNQAEQFVSQLPTYWGPQPMTSGPVYIGAIIVFLFFFGLFAVKGPVKWALLVVTALSIALAMGHNFISLSNFFLDHFPGYNKFRTVSMTLYIAELTMPLLAFMALKQVYDGTLNNKQFLFAFKWSLGIAGGLSLIFLLLGGSLFNFSGEVDNMLISKGYNQILDALRDDRKSMLKADALRSLIYIILSAGALLAFYFKKLKPSYFIAILGLLIVADMWVVNKRYMNNSQFVSDLKADKPFTPSTADKQILLDKALDYRVYNLTVSPFNDGSTSYYHKSIGGYHGAKMRRYQELIDEHINKETNDLITAFNSKISFDSIQIALSKLHVLNMLNTKYIIYNPDASPLVNKNALGNAWFVDAIKIVPNADAEIAALSNFNPLKTAIVDKRFNNYLEGFTLSNDTTGTIVLTDYQPNKLVYKSDTKVSKIAVFSEIYYPKGWSVTIDGKKQDHFRADYVLRAMVIPAGTHEIVFFFKPRMFDIGKKVDLASSLLIILAFIGWIALEIKNRFKE